jgi:hypothetical protein
MWGNKEDESTQRNSGKEGRNFVRNTTGDGTATQATARSLRPDVEPRK